MKGANSGLIVITSLLSASHSGAVAAARTTRVSIDAQSVSAAVVAVCNSAFLQLVTSHWLSAT